MKYDCVIVGAGLAGSVFAERVANQLDQTVLIIEHRNHVGGNAYDFYNEDGILVQQYGPHIFHTNNESVWQYLSNFTEWNHYTHRVLASVRGKEVPLPINLETMEILYDRPFTPQQLKEHFETHRVKQDTITNARDVVLSQVGQELYELFFKNYTKKQWGVYPEQLAAEVTRRLPVRYDRDTRYFTDTYQGLPKHGFTHMFDRMLANENIHLLLKTDYRDVLDSIECERRVFTGPIDQYFNYKFGKLPYRSMDFRFETVNVEQYQNAGVINYPNDHDYTRITEFKYLYEQSCANTTICFEYPMAEGSPHYPIPNPRNNAIYDKYKQEAEKLEDTCFIGRLAQYKYMNMDQVVATALDAFDEQMQGARKQDVFHG